MKSKQMTPCQIKIHERLSKNATDAFIRLSFTDEQPKLRESINDEFARSLQLAGRRVKFQKVVGKELDIELTPLDLIEKENENLLCEFYLHILEYCQSKIKNALIDASNKSPKNLEIDWNSPSMGAANAASLFALVIGYYCELLVLNEQVEEEKLTWRAMLDKYGEKAKDGLTTVHSSELSFALLTKYKIKSLKIGLPCSSVDPKTGQESLIESDDYGFVRTCHGEWNLPKGRTRKVIKFLYEDCFCKDNPSATEAEIMKVCGGHGDIKSLFKRVDNSTELIVRGDDHLNLSWKLKLP